MSDEMSTAEREAETEHISNVFERIALEQMQSLPEQPERERKAAVELEAFKQKLWREQVQTITGVWVARNAFLPAAQYSPAQRVVSQWLADGCPYSLMLRGGVGTTKTSAACLAVKTWCEPSCFYADSTKPQVDPVSMRARVTWLRPDQLVSAVMHSYDEKAPRLHKYVVIDDMGRETRGEFVEALCELFDRDGHTILLTSNLTKEAMRKRYTDVRLVDRLRERVVAIDIQGNSMRPQQKIGGGF